MHLGQLKAGDFGRVIAFSKESLVHRRKLLAMGLLPGTRFKVCRIAPMGDPMQLEIRDFQLSVRRNESRIVEVERL